jgi:hypothetical protein
LRGVEYFGLDLDADRNVHPGREIEFLEFVHCPGGWIHNIEKTLMGPDLKLLG